MLYTKHTNTLSAALFAIVVLLVCSACPAPSFTEYDRITPSANDSYAPLQKQTTSEYRMISIDTLRIRYRELYESNQLQYSIFDSKHQEIQSQANYPVPIRYGTNYLDIKLVNLTSGTAVLEGRYLLEVRNAKNFKQYLSFYLK